MVCEIKKSVGSPVVVYTMLSSQVAFLNHRSSPDYSIVQNVLLGCLQTSVKYTHGAATMMVRSVDLAMRLHPY
jgi:hypothetical protein